MSGVVIVPSRGRPANIADLIDSFNETDALGAVDLVVAVDADDSRLDDYRQAATGAALHVGEPARMGPVLNREATALAPQYDWVGFMGDDHRPRTPGWWKLVDEALAAGPGVAYGDDLLQRANLPTAVFITAELITRLGYMAPPGLLHLFLDDFWLGLGRATRLVYLPDMVIEHLHPYAAKADWDDGYQANNSRATIDHDQAEFDRYMCEDWPTEQLKLL